MERHPEGPGRRPGPGVAAAEYSRELVRYENSRRSRDQAVLIFLFNRFGRNAAAHFALRVGHLQTTGNGASIGKCLVVGSADGPGAAGLRQ